MTAEIWFWLAVAAIGFATAAIGEVWHRRRRGAPRPPLKDRPDRGGRREPDALSLSLCAALFVVGMVFSIINSDTPVQRVGFTLLALLTVGATVWVLRKGRARGSSDSKRADGMTPQAQALVRAFAKGRLLMFALMFGVFLYGSIAALIDRVWPVAAIFGVMSIAALAVLGTLVRAETKYES